MKTATGNGTRFASYSVLHTIDGVMTETFGARTEAEAIAQAQAFANESQTHATARKTGWERCERVTVWTLTIEPIPTNETTWKRCAHCETAVWTDAQRAICQLCQFILDRDHHALDCIAELMRIRYEPHVAAIQIARVREIQ